MERLGKVVHYPFNPTLEGLPLLYSPSDQKLYAENVQAVTGGAKKQLTELTQTVGFFPEPELLSFEEFFLKKEDVLGLVQFDLQVDVATTYPVHELWLKFQKKEFSKELWVYGKNRTTLEEFFLPAGNLQRIYFNFGP